MFDGYAYVKSVTDDLIAQGFSVGKVVVLTKRVTAEFGNKRVRADVIVGERGIVKGCDETNAGIVYVEFEKEINGKLLPGTHPVKIDKLAFPPKEVPDAGGAKGSSGGKGATQESAAPGTVAALPKTLRFLATPETTSIQVMDDWEQQQTIHDPRVLNHHFFGTVGFLLSNAVSL